MVVDVADAPNFQNEMRRLLRERVIETARRLVCTEGWGAVNMSRVAREVGVSRPVLYKEIGTKQDLAEVVIAGELESFLAGVTETVATEPGDLLTGITAAAEYTLRAAADNTLLKVVLAGRSGADTTLLPALMTEPEPVLGRATAAFTAILCARYRLDSFDEAELGTRVEAVVRLVLSHLFQPTGTIDRAVVQIALVAGPLFTPAP